MTDESRWPLEGVKVLDLGQIYNGPYAGFLLAHAGADVVKVEPLGGEVLRRRGGGLGTPFSLTMLNTKKRGLSIDLKHPEGKQLLLDLVREADVLLENFAPGAMARLGLDAEYLREINPRLIYGSSSGYGLSGPDRDNLAMDLTVQAIGGVMSINGPEDGPPLKAGLAVCDFAGGVHLYAAIMTALFERSITGRGRVVEVAMQEAVYPILTSNIASMQRRGWTHPPRRGNKHPTNGSAPYNVYQCADGHVAIICVQEAHWLSLCDLMDRADLKEDPHFKTQAIRAENEDLVDEAVEAWTRTLPKAEAARLMRENRVPAAQVRNLEEVTSDPHMHERGMLHNIEHPTMGQVVVPTSPLRFHGSPAPSVTLEPGVGEHTEDVLREWLGMSDAAITSLRQAEAVG